MVGAERTLSERSLSIILALATSVEDEIAIYRRWKSSRTVDGVIVVDPRDDDERVNVLTSIGLPFVYTGQHCEGAASVSTSDHDAMVTIVDHLAEVGCHSLAYIHLSHNYQHVRDRGKALLRRAAHHGIDAFVAPSDGESEDAGAHATSSLLPHIPDAVVYDNEILTLGGYGVLSRHGYHIGQDVRVVSCEDSPICRVLPIPVTALHRSPADLGALAAEALLALLDGEGEHDMTSGPPKLTIRQSTM